MRTRDRALTIVWTVCLVTGLCACWVCGDEVSDQLLAASATGNLEQVEAALVQGAQVNCTRADGLTPLMVAAINGHAKIVVRLLKAGADVNARDANGATALVWVSSLGGEDMAKLLLAAGANVSIKDNQGRTALSAASDKGHARIVALLKPEVTDLRHRGPERAPSDSAGLDLQLISAALEGKEAPVAQLLDNGADIECQDPENGGTPLIWSSYGGHAGTVKLLLARGAKVNARSHGGLSALLVAAVAGHKEVVELLLGAGADIDARSNEGVNAFTIAAQKDHSELLHLLLKHCSALPWGESTVQKVDKPGQCLTVRRLPSNSSEKVGCLKHGEQVLLNGLWTEDRWVNIFKPVSGWISADQIDGSSLPPNKRAVLAFQQPDARGASGRSGGHGSDYSDVYPDEVSHDGDKGDRSDDSESFMPRRSHGWH